jgi:Rap1a immunity proteins
MRQRSLWLALSVVLAAATPVSAPALAASGFALDDFQVETAQDLFDICALDPSHPSYWAAQAFCYGYFQGGADFHQSMSSAPEFQPVACPTGEATVRNAVDAFIDYARAHPEHLSEQPMDVVFRAVSERWPCS